MEIILLALVAILIGLNIYLYRLIAKEERVYATKLTILTVKVDTLVEEVKDLQHDMIGVLKDVHKLKGVSREHSSERFEELETKIRGTLGYSTTYTDERVAEVEEEYKKIVGLLSKAMEAEVAKAITKRLDEHTDSVGSWVGNLEDRLGRVEEVLRNTNFITKHGDNINIVKGDLEKLAEEVKDLQHDKTGVLKYLHKLKDMCIEHSHKLDKYAERLEP